MDKSKNKVEETKKLKQQEVEKEMKVKTEKEKILIYQLEKEAQNLEKEEEELIQRLQTIQTQERDAFKDLEDAMISASYSRKERMKVMGEVGNNIHRSTERGDADNKN